MKYYYKDTNGNLYANPSNLEGLVEVESAVRTDGTLLPKHKNLGDVETKEDGSYYTYYNQDGTADLVQEQEAIDEAEALAVKQGKDEALELLRVTTNLVPFDANAQSINYMSSVVALASAEYCLVTSQGTSPTVAYNAIFKTVIPWKNADNTNSQVEIETVKEALRESMNAVGAIKTGAVV